MVQIIQANQRPSFSGALGQQLGSGLSQGVQKSLDTRDKMKNLAKENEAIKANFGIDLTNITDPDQRKLVLQQQLQGQREDKSFQQKLMEGQAKQHKENQEKLAPFEAGLDTINHMRQLGKGGRLGRGSSFKSFFGGKTAKDTAEYEQLGKSLISLASTIPIRNKAEFETLAHNLYDASLPDSAREGILDAMENIIRRNMQAYQSGEDVQASETIQSQNPKQNNQQKEKPPLNSFFR